MRVEKFSFNCSQVKKFQLLEWNQQKILTFNILNIMKLNPQRVDFETSVFALKLHSLLSSADLKNLCKTSQKILFAKNKLKLFRHIFSAILYLFYYLTSNNFMTFMCATESVEVVYAKKVSVLISGKCSTFFDFITITKSS